MKYFKLLSFIVVFLVLAISCSKDMGESIVNEQTAEQINHELVFKSLDDINNILLSEKIETTKEHVKEIVLENFSKLLIEHEVKDLKIDTENILVQSSNDINSYTLFITIPQKNAVEELNLYGYLTMQFNSISNIENKLQIGYQMENSIEFNNKGEVIRALTGYYNPKPWNKPSKAPKAVICSYFANSAGSIPSAVVSYCGFYWSGQYYPAPQSVIDMLDAQATNRNTNNLYMRIRYWYDTSGTIYEIPFSQYSSVIKDDITQFYHTVYLTQGPYYNTNNKTEVHHVHKQSFIDSFQNWFYRTKDNAPNTYNYLISNQTVFEQVFKLFSEIHLGAEMEDGVYMEVPYGIYSSNPDIRCISNISNYLHTTSGLSLLQYLGANYISYNSFRDALLSINCD